MKALFLDCNDQLAPVWDKVVRPDDPPIAVNTAPFAREELPQMLSGYAVLLDDHSAMPTELVTQCAALKHIVFLGTGAASYMNVDELKSRGVTVHTSACDKVLTIDPLRRVDVSWDTKAADVKRPVSIRVITDDRPGVLAQISKTISEAGMNISQATCRTTGIGRAVNTFEMAIGEVKQLRSIMRSIEALEGVISVERVYSAERAVPS